MPQRISPKHLVATTTGLGTNLTAALRWPVLKLVVLGGLVLFGLTGTITASAATPCCGITNIAKSGEITAKETKGARTFRFRVADPALRSKQRVGSPVYANFDTKQVSLDGKKPCCKILSISTVAKQPAPGTMGSAATIGALAQTRRSTNTPRVPPVPAAGTVELMSDLVAQYQRPQSFVESYTAANPCTPHSHTRTSRVLLGGRLVGSSLPTPAATLYRDGQQIDHWPAVAAGALPIDLGSFTWTFQHDCPGPGISSSPAPANNYRLVVDPGGHLPEQSEQNNAIEFYVPPSASWTKRQ